MQEILSNDYRMGEQNLAMNIYVIERESLIHLIHDAAVRGLVYFERDIPGPQPEAAAQRPGLTGSGGATPPASPT